MHYKTAIIIGASGATGKELVKQLITNEFYISIKLFVRKSTNFIHPKIEEHIVDFEHIENWKNLIQGDDLFSALGTTIKIAKSKQNQFNIDYNYQFNFAKFAAENKVNNYALVSAYGANSKSLIFYSKIKGELEDAVKLLNFNQIHIFRPGILDRKTQDNRKMEKLSLKIIHFFNKIGFLKSQKPLPVKVLAKKMIFVCQNPSISHEKIIYYSLDEISKI